MELFNCGYSVGGIVLEQDLWSGYSVEPSNLNCYLIAWKWGLEDLCCADLFIAMHTPSFYFQQGLRSRITSLEANRRTDS
ncbi:hypothetical protein SADUNF_Sadunf05G0122900 [Salix dunnii]|uniref:Uncharacterized protein n=1 Tax=Salix dunnii TaxID=1413687 RepID=A0A835KAZ2_9ROSI|nr:hypothetical protein SADUNF_Sadunf05G0122900 [Salix dunnii]